MTPRPRHLARGLRRSLLALGLGLGTATALAAGCNSSNTTLIDDFAVTSVSVKPENFLGAVSCVGDGMKVYVATLFDVSINGDGGGSEFPLPSSEPTSCFRELRFERVVIGREYVADIQGYDRDDIVPLGCFPDAFPGCSGSPVMVDRATGAYVAPRWTTSCGRHRTAPVTPQSVDAGTSDSGVADSGAVPVQDSGTLDYFGCRGQAVVSGQTPWLEGPVCVQDLVTTAVRGCDPLVDQRATP